MDVDDETARPSPVMVGTPPEWRVTDGHWLLGAAPSLPQAIAEWRDAGAAWLLPGELFAAVLVPAYIVHAGLGVDGPEQAAGPLGEVVDGPVFWQPDAFAREAAYVALLTAGAARGWSVPRTVLHASRGLVLVPAPDRQTPDAGGPWWAVAPEDHPRVCSPLTVSSLVAAGRRRVGRLGGGGRD